MATLTMNYKNMPEGVECDVPPYGRFANGAIYEVAALEEDIVVGTPLPEGTELTPWPAVVAEETVVEDPPVNPDPPSEPALTKKEWAEVGKWVAAVEEANKKDGE